MPCLPYPLVRKTDLKIPKGLSEVVNRRTADITMAKMFFIIMLCICSMYIYMCYLVCLYLVKISLILISNYDFRTCALHLLTISWAPEFTQPLVFSGVCIAQSLVFCVVFCRVLFILLSFFALRTNAFYLQTFLLIMFFRMYINTLLVYH